MTDKETEVDQILVLAFFPNTMLFLDTSWKRTREMWEDVVGTSIIVRHGETEAAADRSLAAGRVS